MSNPPQWTLAEEKYVRDNYKTMSDIAMGKAIKRTEHSIATRRKILGCHRVPNRPPVAEYRKERRLIRDMWGNYPTAEISKIIRLSLTTILRLAKEEGLGRNPASAMPAPCCVPSAPKGYNSKQIAWAEEHQLFLPDREIIGRRSEADLILAMHAEGKL